MNIFDRVRELKEQGKAEEEAFKIASREAKEEQESRWPRTEEGRKEWGFEGKTPKEQARIDEDKEAAGRSRGPEKGS